MQAESHKLLSIAEACATITDGSIIGIGGVALYRRPAALARGILRQGERNLTLLGLTLGFETELLLAGGCVGTIRSGYVGLDFLGLAPHFGKDRNVRAVEETEASIIQGLRATLAHVDFLPFPGTRQTDLMVVRPDLRIVRSPYSEEEYVAWPALKLDVALIHASMADEQGNAVLGSNLTVDRLLVAAARRTILSAERIVPTDEIQRVGADVLGRSVSAVVHAPFGAHPTSCYPDYRMDVPYLLRYLEACRTGSVEPLLREAQLPAIEYVKAVVLPNREHLLVLEGR